MPVTNEEFEAAARRGLGRAVLWLQRGEVIPNRDFLLHACTHNLTFYFQSAEDRARYMFDIIQATSEPEFYSQFVRQSLDEISDDEDDWWEEDERSIGQMFGLLGLLAKNGDYSVRKSLYSFFEKHSAGSDYSRAEVIVNIDGLDGYLVIVHQWILHPRKQEDHWTEAWLLEQVEERFGLEIVQSFLEQAAEAEPAIGMYLTEVREKQTAWHKRQGSKSRRDRPGYAELRRRIFNSEASKGRMPWDRWGATVSEDDAEKLAAELLAETNSVRLERYLRLFQRRPFPFDYTPLLALARSGDQQVVTAARAALARIEHSSIHDLALELMETDERPWELIELLARNFREGDEKAIERILEEPWGAKKTERIGLELRKVVEENITVALAPALLLFYERGYCTMCRHGTIELLDELGQLPPCIVEEGQYDADDSIREYVEQVISSNGAA